MKKVIYMERKQTKLREKKKRNEKIEKKKK